MEALSKLRIETALSEEVSQAIVKHPGLKELRVFPGCRIQLSYLVTLCDYFLYSCENFLSVLKKSYLYFYTGVSHNIVSDPQWNASWSVNPPVRTDSRILDSSSVDIFLLLVTGGNKQ